MVHAEAINLIVLTVYLFSANQKRLSSEYIKTVNISNIKTLSMMIANFI